MSYETYALTKDLVEVEERKNLSLKGVNRIVKCYAVKQRIIKRVNKNSDISIKDKMKYQNIEKHENSLEERMVIMEQNMKIIIKKLNKLKL